MLGYLAGNSYARIDKAVGRGAAIVVAVIVITVLIVWRVHGGAGMGR